MTATYRALFCDLRTDQVIDALPITQVSFEDYIGKTGALTGTLHATDRATAQRITTAVVPGRTALWLWRDREIWWGGIVWTLTRHSATRAAPARADIQAATFDSYLDHRLLDADLRANADQFAIARRLVDFALSTKGGDIGIRLNDTQASGVKRSVTHSRYDLPKLRDLLDKLAQMEDGFEWRIRAYRDDLGQRVKELQLGYPRITTTRGAAETILDYPGPVVSYRFPYDATTRATNWQSRGAADSKTQRPLLSTPMYIKGAIDAGWPRLDGTSDYTDITGKADLDAHAVADLTEAWTREVIPEVEVNLDSAQLTPAIVGATIRLRIADVWTAPGYTARYRVVGVTVRAPERSQPESASLTLDAATHSELGDTPEEERSQPLWL